MPTSNRTKQMFELMSGGCGGTEKEERKYQGPHEQLFPLHEVMKSTFGERGRCNSVEENEAPILKGWQMVDAGSFLPCAINIYSNPRMSLH